MATKEELSAALDQVDTATSQLGTLVSAAAAEQQSLFDRLTAAIANGATPEEMQALVDKASAITPKLTAVAASLAPLGSDPSNPVPVPPAVG